MFREFFFSLIEILLGGCLSTDAVGVRGGPAEVKLVGVFDDERVASRDSFQKISMTVCTM